MTAVIEGEVVGADVAVLPPDVQSRVDELRPLDGAAQAVRVTAMLSHARTGLLVAIAAQDLPQIVEWKQKASAIQEIAKQVRMGKEFQLDAAEFVRRAERGLGVAIRQGQADGTVETKSDASRRGTVVREMNQGRRHSSDEDLLDGKVRPTDLASVGELQGARGDGIYAMTDGVSDEQFEEALTQAREEGNLSRANVARKAKSKARRESVDADDSLTDATASNPSDDMPSRPKPDKAANQFKKNSTEMVETINHMLQGAVQTLAYADAADVDPRQAGRLRTEISTSLNAVRKFVKGMPNV